MIHKKVEEKRKMIMMMIS
jgi:hypothetical protein